ncbi:hypothetical protein ABZ770_41540 [Streptomyces sp. NPDC006654]|uniref:hypothetical protein n=1 Tax=unclassified Streptomyces TaxID=2593676 RepID=UPI0033D4966E
MAAVLGSAQSASAWTGRSFSGAAVTDVRTAARFDFAAGEIPENITADPDGSVTLSLLGSCAVCQRTRGPELMRIDASGHRTVLVTGQVGEAISRVPFGPPARTSPVSSATQAPSRLSPSGSMVGVQADAGTLSTCWWIV